jgi:multidrug efflux pump subunit AcrA (membrane-fusion protein)
VGIRLPRGRKRVLWSAVAVVVVAAGVGAWLVFGPSAGEPAAQSLTARATSGPQRQTVSASGTVQPARRADLEFAVSGTVTAVLVGEGDTVKAGQELARVDSALLQAQADAAEATLDAAQAKRADDDGASDTQLAADDAAVVSAQSRLDAARADLGHARLRSTIAGTVASVGLAVGDQVSAGGSSDGDSPQDGSDQPTSPSAAQDDQSDDSTTGFTVVSTDRFVVSASVAAASVKSVKKGQQAEITPVDATEPVEGTVTSVAAVAETDDNGAATFPVTIDVTGTHDDLYAGSSATVGIVTEERDDVLTVPSQALHGDGKTTYVNKIVRGSPVRTTVRIGTAYGPLTEIVSGLAEGDEVELAGFARLPGSTDRGTGGTNEGPKGGGPVMIPGGGGSFPGNGSFPGGK